MKDVQKNPAARGESVKNPSVGSTAKTGPDYKGVQEERKNQDPSKRREEERKSPGSQANTGMGTPGTPQKQGERSGQTGSGGAQSERIKEREVRNEDNEIERDSEDEPVVQPTKNKEFPSPNPVNPVSNANTPQDKNAPAQAQKTDTQKQVTQGSQDSKGGGSRYQGNI